MISQIELVSAIIKHLQLKQRVKDMNARQMNSIAEKDE